MSKGRDALCDRLGHRFSDPTLLNDALTHRSARGQHNERLEFLGDAVLALVIADALYRRHETLPEGDLSRMRAALVCGPSLAAIARELEVGDQMILGGGEMKSGGYRRDSTLGDAVEALIGAVFLDAGFDAARDAVLRVFESRLDSPPDPASLKDPKTRLQELVQARGLPLPVYTVVDELGEPHRRIYRVSCVTAEPAVAREGEAHSRRAAEQAAAERVLAALEGGND
ncbi:MAG: ribonuclease III [Gammaproteobacteria bacterium]